MAKVDIKRPIIEEIKGHIADAKTVVLVDYRGLTVEQDTMLRKKLREAGVVYKVYKNTMLTRAFEGTVYSELNQHLEGPTAVAISTTEATIPAKILLEVSKVAPLLEFKAGVVDGTYYDAKGMAIIATIPSREELLSKFLGSIQSPIVNFARIIKQIADKQQEA